MSPFLSGNGSQIKSPISPENEFDYYTKIQQTDIVPTISTLLGWTIPRNNLGVLLKSFLALWKGK
jgi:ethanolamine phosphate transferase 2 subunit G